MSSFVTESKLTVELFCHDFVDLVCYWNENINPDRPFKNIEVYENEYGNSRWKLQWRSKSTAERFAKALGITNKIECDNFYGRRWATLFSEKQLHDLFRMAVEHYFDLPADMEMDFETVDNYNFIVPSHLSVSFQIDGKLAKSIKFEKLFEAEQNLCWLKS
jgi:hypothetical protein